MRQARECIQPTVGLEGRQTGGSAWGRLRAAAQAEEGPRLGEEESPEVGKGAFPVRMGKGGG